MSFKPDIILYGVYIPNVEGPQADFRTKEDAEKWAYDRFGSYEIKINYAKWSTEEEKKEVIAYHECNSVRA